jgi:hypothetical protein
VSALATASRNRQWRGRSFKSAGAGRFGYALQPAVAAGDHRKSRGAERFTISRLGSGARRQLHTSKQTNQTNKQQTNNGVQEVPVAQAFLTLPFQFDLCLL